MRHMNKSRSFRPATERLESISLVSLLAPIVPRLSDSAPRQVATTLELDKSLASHTIDYLNFIDYQVSSRNLNDIHEKWFWHVDSQVGEYVGTREGQVTSVKEKSSIAPAVPSVLGITSDEFSKELSLKAGAVSQAANSQPEVNLVQGGVLGSNAQLEDGVYPMTRSSYQYEGDLTSAEHYSGTDELSGGCPDPSGGCNPSPPPDKDPDIDFSGGTTVQRKDPMGNKIEGQFYVDGTVSVGTRTFISVSAPATSGYVIDTTTIEWSGGTLVSDYLPNNADEAAPETEGLVEDVDEKLKDYIFVVDAHARDYIINVKVKYTNGASGESTLEFKSVRPVIATLVPDSNPVPIQRPVQPEAAQYRDPTDSFSGMTMKADTQAHADHGGEFMIMQIAYPNRSYTDSNNVVVQQGGGPYIDDGAAMLGLGMEIITGDNSWTLKAGQSGISDITIAEDAVSVPAPNPDMDKKVTVGHIGNPNDPKDPNIPERFITYLMFRPEGEVWVALAKLEWGWGLHLERVNGVWQVVAGSSQNPDPDPVNPIPPGEDDFWPTWNGKTSGLQWGSLPLQRLSPTNPVLAVLPDRPEV